MGKHLYRVLLPMGFLCVDIFFLVYLHLMWNKLPDDYVNSGIINSGTSFIQSLQEESSYTVTVISNMGHSKHGKGRPCPQDLLLWEEVKMYAE